MLRNEQYEPTYVMSVALTALVGSSGLFAGAGLIPAAKVTARVLACENIEIQQKLNGVRTKVSVAAGFAFVCVALAMGHQNAASILIGAALAWTLCLLALVDYETLMLPDAFTIPMIVAGLLANAIGWRTSLADAFGGAALAFTVLWSVNAFHRIRKGDAGMGQGDFKLAAGIGAWFGMYAVPHMLLIAATAGLLFGAANRLRGDDLMPFGPFLSVAGLMLLLIGPEPLARFIGAS